MFIVNYRNENQIGWNQSAERFQTIEQAEKWISQNLPVGTQKMRTGEYEIESLKNPSAQALGKLKKGVIEKPSFKKQASGRINTQKARDALKIKRDQLKGVLKTESTGSD